MKSLLVALLLSVSTISFAAHYDIKSRTFFTVIPHFQIGTPERDVLFRDHFLMNDTKRCVLEAVVFGSTSQNSDRLAQYFLPFGRCELLVAEQNAAGVLGRDVDAIHLNINHVDPGNTFQSKVKFGFEQNVLGVGLAARARIFEEKDSKWWVAASAPIEEVCNKTDLCEKIENKGTNLEATRVASVKEAFKQKAWHYGRIDCEKHKKIGVADVELQLGYQWKTTGKSHGETYVGVVIPTGNKPEGRVVFEPIVGNNHHFGVLFGTMLSEEFYNDGEDVFYFIVGGNGCYLFSNEQVRSFDLTDKQWGRYMEVYENVEAAEKADAASGVVDGARGTPGINMFTRCVNVSPRFMQRFNSAILYKHKPFHAEVGYNLTSRQSEKVTLKKCFSGVALVAGEGNGIADGKTTKSRTINHQAAGSDDYTLPKYAALTLRDLDATTAAHPALISGVLYASLGYQPTKKDSWLPTVGIGGSYEFSQDNTSLDRWTAWIKGCLIY